MLLFLIKLTHSIIIIYMLICLFALWHYALTGMAHPFLQWALLSIITEGIVFIAWSFECPLTIWALNLGDETGVDLLSEIFLLEAVDYTSNFVIFFAIGLILSVRRYMMRETNSPIPFQDLRLYDE